jgi:hypothetical protein
MSLAEGVQGSIRYKAYATGAITSNTQPVSTVDPAVTGGQILRRVSSSLKLAKDTYQSNEIRSDRQIQDFRHGTRRVTGSISGEFSPGTYFDFIEASCRGTKSAALALSNTDFTSITSDSATSKFTVTGGNPVTSGLRTGDIIRPANLATAANNATNFVITGFGGANNRDILVYPPPVTDAVADSSFNLTSNGASGKAIFVPSSSFVSRKFGIEVHNADIDVSRLFTECRSAGFTLQLPATGLSTIELPFMGRDMETYSGGSAPFFTAPAAATTTGIFAAVNGLLRLGGATVGVVTGLNIQMDLNPSSDAVVGQNFVPEIFLGRANVTGQVTALFEDLTTINYFKNETEISIIAYLTTTSTQPAPACTIYLPRLKFGDGNVSDQGEGGQTVTLPFQALKADGTVAGDEATTIRVVDTQAV